VEDRTAFQVSAEGIDGCFNLFCLGRTGVQIEVLIPVAVVHPQVKTIVQFQIPLKVDLQFVALQLIVFIVAGGGDIVKEVIDRIHTINFDHGVE